jgi:hypothetical protein
MADKYSVEIKSPTGALVDSIIIDGALEAAEWMESKLVDLPDGYWGHIQVIGGDE